MDIVVVRVDRALSALVIDSFLTPFATEDIDALVAIGPAVLRLISVFRVMDSSTGG